MNECFFDKKISYANGSPLLISSGSGTRKFNQVIRPAQKIMFIDEDEKTVNNGEFNPTVLLANADISLNNKDFTAIASRHTMKTVANSTDVRGNVGFADGHVEFFSRTDALKPEHYDPDAD